VGTIWDLPRVYRKILGFDILSQPKESGGVELEITALSRGGAGLGRDAAGRVIFVPYTCPGDRVRVEIVEESKRFADAKLLEVLEPSPTRVAPKCPVFQKCGGCEWQHLPYSLQWETKKSGVFHALERVGVDWKNSELVEFPADQIWEYRNRVQLRGFRENLGFYERKSKTIVPIDRCEIARPEINAFLGDVRSDGQRRVREYKAEVEVFPSGVVTISWNSSHSAQGFRQVHDEQNTKLQTWVKHSLLGGDLLFDLYGGSGNLSLALRDLYSEIHCVDIGAPDSQKIDESYHFHRSPVFPWLQKNRANFVNGKTLDVVLDPPREGMAEDLGGIVEILKQLPVRRILSIGCETDSWARGIHRFLRAGFQLSQVGALDFFPHTHHVESLAILESAPIVH
jgi:23S rRNA (uracil1939-C5)-methyltransferase